MEHTFGIRTSLTFPHSKCWCFSIWLWLCRLQLHAKQIHFARTKSKAMLLNFTAVHNFETKVSIYNLKWRYPSYFMTVRYSVCLQSTRWFMWHWPVLTNVLSYSILKDFWNFWFTVSMLWGLIGTCFMALFQCTFTCLINVSQYARPLQAAQVLIFILVSIKLNNQLFLPELLFKLFVYGTARKEEMAAGERRERERESNFLISHQIKVQWERNVSVVMATVMWKFS